MRATHKRVRVTPVALLVLSACATGGARTEAPKLPMGIGQVAIDAVTNDPDEESSLRISPDGRFLLFNNASSAKARSGRGFLGNIIQQSSDRQIASYYEQNAISLIELGKPGKSVVSQEGAADPGWFPDGRSFVFSMLQGRQAMLASSGVGQGSASVRFVSPTPCVAYDRAPSVSANGQTLIFSTVTATDAVIATMDVRAADSKCKVLFPGRSPQWSPVGRKVVFVRVVGGHDQVFTFDETKNQLTQITFGNYENTDPAWSPDGTHIVFVSTRAGSSNIFTIGEDGGSLVQITNGPTNDRSPTWARDGSIYFVSNAGGQPDIWRARLQAR